MQSSQFACPVVPCAFPGTQSEQAVEPGKGALVPAPQAVQEPWPWTELKKPVAQFEH